jgi:pSer/pThr/pTyr-binding forkhead associated (FHA) protein
VDNQTVPIDSSSNSAEEPLYILSLLNNELMSYSWKLSNDEYSIGRSSSNKIILDDITVSREHALIKFRNKIPQIIDLNSTNGVYINNQLIKEKNLKSGDKIQIGKYLLLLTGVNK